MNNELKRIEERLKSPAASEPPAGLLEKIQDDIPQYLRLISETAKPSSSVWRLRLVAASVVLVVVGGALVYRVSQQAPSLDERLDLSLPEVASVPEPASADQEVEEIESRPASESVAPGKLAASGETETQSARAPVASQEGPRMDATRERSPAPAQRSSAPPAAGVTTVTSERPLLATGLESEMRSLEEKQEPIAGHSRRLDRPASPSTGGTSEPNDAAYGDMFFRSYGTNPFVDTEDDGLSTFGLEVDTGSFTLMRSYLDRGHLPPHEAVRVEEFVNYFDYGDPAPRRGEFTLTAEGAPSPFATGARERLVRFGIKARELARADRESANLIFVVDVSGSMARENRLGLVRQSLLLLLDQLRHDDRIGVVIYGSRGEVLLEPTASKDAIRRAIERLVPSGSTNAEEGLDLAYSLARRHYREDAINRVILCSDGVANVGRTGAESILDRIRIGSDEGIELTTVGFGMGNFNDVLMEQLANQGDGSYVYVDTLEEARRIFVEKLTGTLQTIASDAKVQVEFNPDAVSRYRLLGYENRDIADERFRDDSVDAGEIGSGHAVTALYEIKLHEGVGKRQRLATLRLRYRSKATDEIVESSIDLKLKDLAPSWQESSTALQLSSLAAEFAEVLKGSYWAKDSSLEEVRRRLLLVSDNLVYEEEVQDLLYLVERAIRLSPERRHRVED